MVALRMPGIWRAKRSARVTSGVVISTRIGAGGLHIGKLAERIGRAIGDELAVINVGDVAAAFGFVHVMRGDEKRDAVAGKLEEQIPELAASDGVDAGGGLVEKKKLRLMQHGAAEREALLPTAGKLRGQAIQIRSEAVELRRFRRCGASAARAEGHKCGRRSCRFSVTVRSS